jgi:hypothetical protein
VHFFDFSSYLQPLLDTFKIANGADLAELTFDKLITLKPGTINGLRPFHCRIISGEVMHRKELPMERYVTNSKPYTWPYNGIMHPGNTAVIVGTFCRFRFYLSFSLCQIKLLFCSPLVDMQNDFCNPTFKDGYIKSVNPSCDFADVKAIIPNIQKLLSTMRRLGYRVIHTRECHLPLSADLPANKHWRSTAKGIPGLGDTNGDMKIRYAFFLMKILTHL